ncbi:LPXTG cell wall anchor domain-containing protein [Arthrobacter russicus]
MRKGLGILGLALFAGLVQAPGAAAETGDQWPLTAATAPVQIDPAGLYGSSGNQIFKFTGLQNGQAGTELTAQTAPGAPAYWSSNLGLGRDAQGSLEFVGSRYNTGYPALYSLKNGASSITEIGSAPQTSAAWGGLSVAPDGGIWQGTNLQSTGNSRLSRFDQQAGTGVISGPLTSTLAGDRIWDGGGVVAPDYAFDAAGNLFGLVFNRGEGWIYRYNIDSFSASGMTVTPWLQISGPALTAGSSNYGFAWLGGNWYAGNGNGTLYRINAETGASVVAGEVTTPSTFDYRLTDLASAELVPGPRLEVTKSADRTVVDPGGVVRFTLTGTNTGAATFAADFADELSEVLDEADYNGDASADIGSIGLSGQRLLWRGELAPGQRVTVTFSVTVKAVVPGDYRLVNRVSSTVPEAVLPPPVTVDISGFVLTKTVDRTVAAPGDQVSYTVVGRNVGRTPLRAGFSDDLSQVLDDAAFRGDVDANTGRVWSSADSIRWSGRLLPGQAVTVTYQVVVRAGGGDGILRNSVTSSTSGGQETTPVQTTVREVPGTPQADRAVQPVGPGAPGPTTETLPNTGSATAALIFSGALAALLGLVLLAAARFRPEEDRS